MSIITIYYARVSSQDVSQLMSYDSQITIFESMMNRNKGDVLMTDMFSISNGMSESLKYKIDTLKRVDIVVMNFDRLTRSFNDIEYLRKKVNKITSINENVTIDMKTSWHELLGYITKATQEIDKIKERRSQYNRLKRVPNDEELLFKSEKKIKILHEVIDDANCEKIGKFIHLTQNISSNKDWEKIFSLAKKMGVNDMK